MSDLQNKKFGKLTAIERVWENKHAYWICKCDCGNIKKVREDHLKNNKTLSCGCLQKEKVSNNYIDLTGQVFGRWSVIKKVKNPTNTKGTYWECRCSCGTIRAVSGHSLRSGKSTSCGCKKGKSENLIGQKFGELLVIERVIDQKYSGTGAVWRCKCSCGNITDVKTYALKSGHTTSCGHIKSKGELLIGNILTNLNIIYQRQYSFFDLKDKDKLKFDFGLFDSNNNLIGLLEYQGLQHYIDTNYLQSPIKHDEMKRLYCEQHQIPLIEIPYTDYKNIDENYILQKLQEYNIKE